MLQAPLLRLNESLYLFFIIIKAFFHHIFYLILYIFFPLLLSIDTLFLLLNFLLIYILTYITITRVVYFVILLKKFLISDHSFTIYLKILYFSFTFCIISIIFIKLRNFYNRFFKLSKLFFKLLLYYY